MRRCVRFTEPQELWLRGNYGKVGSYDELTARFNETFGAERRKDAIREKCTKRLGLKGMPNPTVYGKKAKEELPIGTIRRSQTGTYIKVQHAQSSYSSGYSEPYWLPLQKKIWQDAHGELPKGKMVCFLDGNPQNFDLANLYPIDRSIAAIMAKNKWWTSSRELTLTAIKWCELYYAIKTGG